jgi:hypothetical protein
MGNFFSLKYWLNIRPGNLETNAQYAFIIFLFILLAVGIAIHLYIKRQKSGLYVRLWKKGRSFAFINLIIGALLLFFTYEMVPFLSTRILFLFWGLGIIIWLGFVFYKLREIPKIKEIRAKEEEFKKYVP